jgi:hypothetical protein
MHLVFFDEVKSQPDYPFYHIGAIAIAEDSIESIEEEINTVSADIFGDKVLRPSTEFHASDIFHKKKAFKNITNVGERLEILIRLLKILMKSEVSLVEITVNLEKLYNAKYADEYAFMFLCEKANALMKATKSIGMLIGDRDNDSNSERFSISLSQYRAKGTEYQFGSNITNLFESVHFTHSHLSRFLQLADIYAWFLQFQKRNGIIQQKQHKHFFNLIKSNEIRLYPRKYKIWPQ